MLYWGLMAKNEFIISPNPNVENTSNCVKQCNFQEQKYATAPFPKSSSCAPQRLIDDHEKPFIWEAKRCLFEQSSVVVCLHRRCRFTIKTKFVTFPRILAWIARLGTYHSYTPHLPVSPAVKCDTGNSSCDKIIGFPFYLPRFRRDLWSDSALWRWFLSSAWGASGKT